MDRQFAEDVKAYRRRWEAVAEIEAAEQRAASPELRLHQLASAWAIGLALGMTRDEASEMEVMLRWAKLKEKLTPNNPQT
jgi:hypothetical protein